MSKARELAERVDDIVVDSSGNVGIGTASPNQKLTLSGSSSQYANILSINNGNTGVLFGDQDRVDSGYVIYANSAGYLGFGTGGSAGVSATERMRIDSSGNLLVGGATSPSGSGQIVATGGVYVGGTGPANHLDDYEEGTFTPYAIGASVSGTGTYSLQHGSYVKIGRSVTIQVFLQQSAHTGTGQYRIFGLPFANASGRYSTASCDTYSVAYPAGTTTANAHLTSGANYVQILCSGSNTTWSGVTVENGQMFFIFTLTYETNS